jgi:pimeloyl-ACP methyl ester carboxylesterase
VAYLVSAPDGRLLSVESFGDPEGIPVFLMHDMPGCRDDPRPRDIVLYRLGIRLIAYDRPGCGDSTRMTDRRVADAAVDVEAIADHFDLSQFGVVGRSGGAPHALACAALLRDRVIAVAALCSLAPYDAEDLNWYDGMAEFSQKEYRDAADNHLQRLAAHGELAERVRSNPEALLERLWRELPGPDQEVIRDVALRRAIARAHAGALRASADGWIDDLVALSRRWGFRLSDITVPVLLWHGGDDVLSPVSHTKWLAKRVGTSEVVLVPDAGNFGAVTALPEALAWVADKAHGDRGGQPVSSVMEALRGL